MKKSQENINDEIRENPRCHKIIEKHNDILMGLDERSLSKDGRKKLEKRLNEIVIGISKSEKTRNFVLPRISSRKENH